MAPIYRQAFFVKFNVTMVKVGIVSCVAQDKSFLNPMLRSPEVVGAYNLLKVSEDVINLRVFVLLPDG